MAGSLVEAITIKKSGGDEDPSIFQDLSRELLLAIRSDQPSDELVSAIARADQVELRNELNSDAKKKAFWINIYNAFNIRLQRVSPMGKGKIRRLLFLGNKILTVAGKPLSFNDIQHNILRRSRFWWAMGYLINWYPSEFDKLFRVDRLDPRVHFALNFGLESCPPVRVYEQRQINEQLDEATKAYLEKEVYFDKVHSLIRLPGIMSMFKGDFGKRKDLIQFLNRYGDYIRENSIHRIKYGKFDFSISTDNFYID